MVGNRDRGRESSGPSAMPTALRLTNSALAQVRSLNATNSAMYLLLTVLAEPARSHGRTQTACDIIVLALYKQIVLLKERGVVTHLLSFTAFSKWL